MKPLSEAGWFGKIMNPKPEVYSAALLDMNKNNDPEDTLRFFFDLRDRKNVPIVEELFRLYDFKHIAKAIFDKYQVLPAGWYKPLSKLKKSEPRDLEWLDSKKITWMTETTAAFPPIRPTKFLEDDDILEKIVDEFVVNEKEYFQKINAMVTYYISEIKAIASNKIGEHAKNALGLSKEQIENIFDPLIKVHEAVKVFLVMLETVSLVQAPTKTPEGRPGQLGKLFSEAGEGLTQAYAPYNATYMDAKRLLQQQKMTAPKNLEPVEGSLRHMNFAEIWTEISQSKNALKAMAIDAVLILPIRRLPNYMLFIKRLISKGEKVGHASIPLLKQAAEDVQRHTEEINVAAGGKIE